MSGANLASSLGFSNDFVPLSDTVLVPGADFPEPAPFFVESKLSVRSDLNLSFADRTGDTCVEGKATFRQFGTMTTSAIDAVKVKVALASDEEVVKAFSRKSWATQNKEWRVVFLDFRLSRIVKTVSHFGIEFSHARVNVRLKRGTHASVWFRNFCM